MEMRKIIFICFFVFLSGCSGVQDCLTADTIRHIRDIHYAGSDYSLVIKTTGFNDKMRFLALYPANVTFDVCGNGNTDPYLEEYIDETAGNVSGLLIEQNKMTILYSADSNTQTLENMPIEVR